MGELSQWFSGFALLEVAYWFGAKLYLIDPTKVDFAMWQAVLVALAFIVFDWIGIGYDQLCKSPLSR